MDIMPTIIVMHDYSINIQFFANITNRSSCEASEWFFNNLFAMMFLEINKWLLSKNINLLLIENIFEDFSDNCTGQDEIDFC